MTTITGEQLAGLRRFVAAHATGSPNGRRWLGALTSHRDELSRRYAASLRLQRRTDRLLAAATRLIESTEEGHHRPLTGNDLAAAEAVLSELEKGASTGLREVIAEVRSDLRAGLGRTVLQILGPRDG